MFNGAVVNVENVEIFGMIALVVLLAVFIGVMVWVVRIDKRTINELEQLPLDKQSSHEREEVFRV